MAKEAMMCVQLDYVHDFQCDGKLCNAQCCQKWRIQIDKATYKKYKKIKDSKWRKRICEHIRKNQETGNLQIVLDENDKCPFLGGDLLCIIQKNLGESYLSEVCTSYPRQIYKFQKFMERSLTMSCPVALKLALRNDRPLGLELVSLDSNKMRAMSSYEVKNRDDINRYLMDLQILTIPVLQQKKITLWQRLQLLQLVIDIVEPYVQKGQDVPVADIEAAVAELDYGRLRPANDLKQVLILFNQLVEEGLEKISLDGHNYVADVIDALDLQDGKLSVSQLLDKYLEQERFYQEYVEKTYSQMIENFVVNTWFAGCYPMKIEGNICNNYRMFSLFIQLTKLYLLAIAVKKGEGLKQADILTLLERMAVLFEHSRRYIEIGWDFVCSCDNK
ncbi:MAG: flagellin lysine-N-methylase [Selenomonas sp.]|uniref:flagellin lysine-N-methylase n=1 Tax=Selenomonas sp. TaxID=2053611 RepID=UPI0025E85482|nr:flagellin lysine-N-methylase [Selenomonas sp.]MCR5439585.1 flagellin lysine-N-methylase [Selenomonas sp.]